MARPMLQLPDALLLPAMETLPPTFEPPRRRQRRQVSRWSAAYWFYAAVISILTGAIIFIWIWNQYSEERALRALPEAQRRALYLRTLADLESVCAHPHGSDLDGHCRAQAEFMLQFAECDDACRQLAHRQLQTPTR